jgi:hypothetical protein
MDEVHVTVQAWWAPEFSETELQKFSTMRRRALEDRFHAVYSTYDGRIFFAIRVEDEPSGPDAAVSSEARHLSLDLDSDDILGHGQGFQQSCSPDDRRCSKRTFSRWEDQRSVRIEVRRNQP